MPSLMGGKAFAFCLKWVIISLELKSFRFGSSRKEGMIRAGDGKMATTPIGEFIGSDYRGKGSEASADEAGWLARGYRSVRDFAKRHYKVALGAAAGLGAMAAAERGAGASPIVDIDWRLAGDNSNVNYLKDKTTLDPAVANSDVWERPYGWVRFEDGSEVPVGWKLIFLDNGGQPVGMIIMTESESYDTRTVGDMPWTSGIDEGAVMNSPIKVIAQGLDNKFFDAYMNTELSMEDHESPETYNITVTNTRIPEPATLALLGAGAGVAALTRRRRKFQPEMDSNIGKPETPYYRRFE